jgi:hypothetical protein
VEEVASRKGDDGPLGKVADHGLSRQHGPALLGGVACGLLLLQLGLRQRQLPLSLVEQPLLGDADRLERPVALSGELVRPAQRLGRLDLEKGDRRPVVDYLRIAGLEPLLGEVEPLLGRGEVDPARVGRRSVERLLIGSTGLVEPIGPLEVDAPGEERRGEEERGGDPHRVAPVSAAPPVLRASSCLWACSAWDRASCSRASALASSA